MEGNYVSCRISGKVAEFKRVPITGLVAVGIDGRLIGNYDTADAAVFAALEHVRVAKGLMGAPAVSSGLLPAVRNLAAVAVN